MNLEKILKTTTEKLLLTVNLGGWKGKKVLYFFPKDPKYKHSDGHVSELSMFGNSMNVKSITKSGLSLYSYDILNNKTTAKIKWKDVELGNTLDI